LNQILASLLQCLSVSKNLKKENDATKFRSVSRGFGLAIEEMSYRQPGFVNDWGVIAGAGLRDKQICLKEAETKHFLRQRVLESMENSKSRGSRSDVCGNGCKSWI
jgi:hypothetical protein